MECVNADASTDARGLALECSTDGAVTAILRADRGVGSAVAVGSPVNEFAHIDAEPKVRALFEAIDAAGTALDWEITASVDDRLVPLHVAGARSGEHVLIVAAPSRSELQRLNACLGQHSGVHAPRFSRLAEQLTEVASSSAERDDAMYEELTRVNNELANLQRELVKANRRQAELNDEKNRLLGMAAHELRAPLGIVSTYSQFLQDELADVLDEEHLGFVHTIRRRSESMLNLIDDLLDVARIEAGHVNLDLAGVDLVDVVRRSVAQQRVLAARKGIEVDVVDETDADDTVWVQADEPKLDQVLANLIGNAVKFSEPGTAVRVVVDRAGQRARLAVTDEGVGIAPEQLERLFTPFDRGRDRGTAGEQGSGLGLAIVKRIVDAHGGTVEARSASGRGTTFEITIPTTGT